MGWFLVVIGQIVNVHVYVSVLQVGDFPCVYVCVRETF